MRRQLPLVSTLFLTLFLMFPAYGGNTYDRALEERAQGLYAELRCVVCQSESIADSPAAVAQDMRRDIRTRLAQGESEDEIKRYLIARYGDFVLLKPPLSPSTYLLWFAPVVMLLIGIGIIIAYFGLGRIYRR